MSLTSSFPFPSSPIIIFVFSVLSLHFPLLIFLLLHNPTSFSGRYLGCWNISSRCLKGAINKFELLQQQPRPIRSGASETYECDPEELLQQGFPALSPWSEWHKTPQGSASYVPPKASDPNLIAVLYLQSSWEQLRIWASLFPHPNLSSNLTSSGNLPFFFFQHQHVPSSPILFPNVCFSSLELFLLWEWTNPHLLSYRVTHMAIKVFSSTYQPVARYGASQIQTATVGQTRGALHSCRVNT